MNARRVSTQDGGMGPKKSRGRAHHHRAGCEGTVSAGAPAAADRPRVGWLLAGVAASVSRRRRSQSVPSFQQRTVAAPRSPATAQWSRSPVVSQSISSETFSSASMAERDTSGFGLLAALLFGLLTGKGLWPPHIAWSAIRGLFFS